MPNKGLKKGFLINMEGYTNKDDRKRELVNDPQTRREVEALKPKFDVVRAIIAARQAKGLSQAALAERIGTRQSAIARLESGSYNPTVQFLEKIARALDAELTISFRPR